MFDVNDLLKTIKKADTPTLWMLVSDIAETMNRKNYKPDPGQVTFMFWRGVYKIVETELDRRMAVDYAEDWQC